MFLESMPSRYYLHRNVVPSRQQHNRLPETRSLAPRLTEGTLIDQVRKQRRAPAAGPRDVTAIGLHHDAARESNLTVANGVDDVLRADGDLMSFEQAPLELVE